MYKTIGETTININNNFLKDLCLKKHLSQTHDKKIANKPKKIARDPVAKAMNGNIKHRQLIETLYLSYR